MTDFYDQEHSYDQRQSHDQGQSYDQRQELRALPGAGHDAEPEIDLRADPYSVPAVEDLIDQAIDDISVAKTAPMSTLAKVNRDELLDLLEQARDQLPEELRRARWLLKEKAEFLAQAARERDAIIDQGRREVARMAERQAVVRAAEERARSIVEEARVETRLMQRQMEDFCDQKLATFEVLLDRTGQTIRHGREKLLGTAIAGAERGMPTTGPSSVADA